MHPCMYSVCARTRICMYICVHIIYTYIYIYPYTHIYIYNHLILPCALYRFSKNFHIIFRKNERDHLTPFSLNQSTLLILLRRKRINRLLTTLLQRLYWTALTCTFLLNS